MLVVAVLRGPLSVIHVICGVDGRCEGGVVALVPVAMDDAGRRFLEPTLHDDVAISLAVGAPD
jgi:hypothetical protein